LIPLFDGEKQQKTLIPALRRSNTTLQVVDLIGSEVKFRYAPNSGIAAEFVVRAGSAG
jgi:hypothetical protein